MSRDAYEATAYEATHQSSASSHSVARWMQNATVSFSLVPPYLVRVLQRSHYRLNSIPSTSISPTEQRKRRKYVDDIAALHQHVIHEKHIVLTILKSVRDDGWITKSRLLHHGLKGGRVGAPQLEVRRNGLQKRSVTDRPEDG